MQAISPFWVFDLSKVNQEGEKVQLLTLTSPGGFDLMEEMMSTFPEKEVMSSSTEILPGQEKEKCDGWELNEEPVNGSSTLPRPNVYVEVILKIAWNR